MLQNRIFHEISLLFRPLRFVSKQTVKVSVVRLVFKFETILFLKVYDNQDYTLVKFYRYLQLQADFEDTGIFVEQTVMVKVITGYSFPFI